MDIATIIGLLAANALIIWAMDDAAGIDAFVDVTSLAIVMGGSILVLLMRSKMSDFIGMFAKVFMKTIIFGVDKKPDLIEQIIEMANIARKDGLIALEGQDIKNDYLAKGIGLLVDGTAPDVIETSLANELDLMKSRHTNAAHDVAFMGRYCARYGHDRHLSRLSGHAAKYERPKSHWSSNGHRPAHDALRCFPSQRNL